MKLLHHEMARLHKHAELTLNLSPDTKPDVTKKEIAEFSKEVVTSVQRKRQVKHWLLVLIESQGE